MLHAFDEQAWTPRDDGSRHLRGLGFICRLFHGAEILRVDDKDLLIAEGPEHVFDRNGFRRLSLQRVPAAGIVLVSRHARDMVVQNNRHHVGPVIDDLRRAGHAAVEKGGIADNTEYLLFLTGHCKRPGHAGTRREAGAHADAGVQRIQRRCSAQCIAPDIARNDGVLPFGHRVEEASMRASGAEGRGPGNRLDLQLFCLRLDPEKHLTQALRVQLIQIADFFLADAGDPRRTDLLFHKAFQFFHNVQGSDL